MADRHSRPSSPNLDPPPRTSAELEDAGAQDAATDSDDDHFSDASEGHERSRSPSPGRASPVPLTRVERVDENPAHGEVPGTAAYEIREQDAPPDEIAVIPEGSRSRESSTAGLQEGPSSPVPRTKVEKVDIDKPSHGDVPGTEAYEKRKADAIPDVVTTTSDSNDQSASHSPESSGAAGNAADTEVPETVLSKVDTAPSDETTSGPQAHTGRPSDPSPDVTESVPDAPDPSCSPQDDSSHGNHVRGKSSVTVSGETADAEPVDEFDDFAEEQDMGEDDFGDFDDGFQEPTEEAGDGFQEQAPPQPPTLPSVPPLIDFDSFQSTSDLYATLNNHLDTLFPGSKEISSLPPIEPIPNPSAIFNTERSLSLWSQLVAPPPLQPQNWVKSRIRRLFLVSLGVPVDLDEILPASKQKKLVLPSVNSPRASGNFRRSQSLARKDGSRPDSPSTTGPSSRSRTSRRREPSPPPDLDLSAVRRLCATTDAALDGFTDGELKGHVSELEGVTRTASSVLEYWLKRLDGLIGEKEAFEGVIENLVSHARRVRK